MPKVFFGHDGLRDIQQRTEELESNTSAEVRVKIVGKSSENIAEDFREQAVTEFYNEEMNGTRNQTGILILVILDRDRMKRKIEIFTDEGIGEKISQEELNDIAKTGTACLFKGHGTDGVFLVLQKLSEKLEQFFPRKELDINELPNEVIVEDNADSMEVEAEDDKE